MKRGNRRGERDKNDKNVRGKGNIWEKRMARQAYLIESFCCDKHHDQKQSGEEQIPFILQLLAHDWGKSVIKTWGKNSSRTHGGVMLIGLLLKVSSTWLFTLPRTTSPEVPLPTVVIKIGTDRWRWCRRKEETGGREERKRNAEPFHIYQQSRKCITGFA